MIAVKRQKEANCSAISAGLFALPVLVFGDQKILEIRTPDRWRFMFSLLDTQLRLGIMSLFVIHLTLLNRL